MYILPIATRASAGSAHFLRQNYVHDVKLGALIATILAITSVLIASVLFNSRMLPEALRTGYPLFLIMAACMYVSSLSVIPYYYLVALGWLPAIAMVNVVGAAMSFVTALVAVGTLGVTALALAKAWSIVTLSCYWFCHVRLKRQSILEFDNARSTVLGSGGKLS
jgi:O-antigen/teichoic acid export membrane protein